MYGEILSGLIFGPKKHGHHFSEKNTSVKTIEDEQMNEMQNLDFQNMKEEENSSD